MHHINTSSTEPVSVERTPSRGPREPITIAPAPSTISAGGDHVHTSRYFIGPLPVSVAAPQIKRTRKLFRALGQSDDRREATHPDQARSPTILSLGEDRLRKLLRHSEGRHERTPDEWDLADAPQLRAEIMRRLKESAWSGRGQKLTTKWVGDSFQIGTDILGTRVLEHAQHSSKSLPQSATSQQTPTSLGSPMKRPRLSNKPSARTGDTSFVTAPSTLGPLPASSSNDAHAKITAVLNASDTDRGPIERSPSIPPTQHSDVGPSTPPQSETALLALPILEGMEEAPVAAPTRPRSEPSKKLDTRSKAGVLRSALRRALPKEQSFEPPRTRHSVAFSPPNNIRSKSGDQREHEYSIEDAPAPPSEVLARQEGEEELGNTSAGAALQVRRMLHEESQKTLTDRMIVEVLQSRSSGLPVPFDEDERRRHVDIEVVDRGEFIVAWRGNSVELYQDHSIAGKEWLVGHKHLAFVIPPMWPSTRLSIYSYTDMSFCLACPADSRGFRAYAKARLRNPERGTRLFILKPRTRSRAFDWIWKLWRDLGGELPSHIDIHVPLVGTRVAFPLPTLGTDGELAGLASLTSKSIIATCNDVLKDVPSYSDLVHRGLTGMHEVHLALAWSYETFLDWIWLDLDVDGMSRDWSILFGLAFPHMRSPAQLELRSVKHALMKARLEDGTQLEEPPSIEGYVHRIKPNSQVRTAAYLSCHSGYLFTLTPSKATPPAAPRAPDLFSANHDGGEGANFPDFAFTFEGEVNRGCSQILCASGCLDLRDVLVVTRTVNSDHSNFTFSERTPAGRFRDHSRPQRRDLEARTTNMAHIPDGNDSEIDEPGGDEHLAKHPDKSSLRAKRSFEIRMRSGFVMKLEAHSVSSALEWTQRLNSLVRYWTVRHRIDARAETDLSSLSSGRQRITISSKTNFGWGRADLPPSVPDAQVMTEAMGNYWSWCVLKGCQPIIKAGRIHMKNSARYKPFKNFFLILIHGHLILFHTASHSNGHHHHSKSINITDAFVYSGAQAADRYPYAFSHNTSPRRYHDGLETDDSELATTFVLRYRKHPKGWAHESFPPTPQQHDFVPKTFEKDHTFIFRARTKLERDSWCWALNTELERTVRLQPGREEKLRRGVGSKD